MSDPNPAVEAVRGKALTMWRGGKQRYAFAADPNTYARGKKPAVLVAIVTRAGSLVLAIDATDWVDKEETVAEMMLAFIGCEPAGGTALERAKAEKAALPKKK